MGRPIASAFVAAFERVLSARPPRMNERPVQRPDCLAIGPGFFASLKLHALG
jgi:hypothetical protein